MTTEPESLPDLLEALFEDFVREWPSPVAADMAERAIKLARELEQQLSAATAEIERLRAERDRLAAQLAEVLPKLADKVIGETLDTLQAVGERAQIGFLAGDLGAATKRAEQAEQRLRHLAELASPGQVPEGYEDAVILAAIREQPTVLDALRRWLDQECAYSVPAGKVLAKIAELSASAPSEESEPPTAGGKGTE